MQRRPFLVLGVGIASLLAGCTDAGDDIEELEGELDEDGDDGESDGDSEDG